MVVEGLYTNYGDIVDIKKLVSIFVFKISAFQSM